ncbi:MAG: ubiquitin-like domain-containing protein [Candidatus Hodarchaeales archaeon]
MKIKVVSAIGGGEIPVSVNPDDPVRVVKQIVADQKRIPANTILVVFRGQQLDDNQTLQDAGITDHDKVYLITRTVGG